MTTPRRHHYVPQSYLRRFSRGSKIAVYDKPTGRIFRCNMSNVAVQQGFYHLPDRPVPDPSNPGLALRVDPQAVERLLSDYETAHSTAISRLLSDVERAGVGGAFSPDHRGAVSPFVVLQLVRTIEFRTLAMQASQGIEARLALISKALWSRDQPGTEPPTRRSTELTDEQLAALQAIEMLSPGKAARYRSVIEGHIWSVGITTADTPLYTSDHPVVYEAQKGVFPGGRRLGLGIGSPYVEIAVPLNPKYLLHMYDRVGFAERVAADCTCVRMTQENINYYNRLQVFRSTRQVYSQTTDDFSLAHELCEAYPDLRDPHRPRVSIW